MKIGKILFALVMGIVLIAIAFFLFLEHGRVERETRSFPVMGTVASLDLYDNSRDMLNRAADDAQNEIRRLESMCNIYDKNSELSRLNATAFQKPFRCSDELWEILLSARKYYELSDGSFDITVKPLMTLWGFHRRRCTMPERKEIDEAMKLVGLKKVIFDDKNKTVRFSVDGIGLDLGGIAKGYALDKARRKVLRRGVDIGILDLGGNLFCLPKPIPEVGRDHYRVGIKNPLDKSRIMTVVPMLDSVIATSGDYERYVIINGKQYTHIIDAKTGYPVQNMLSVSVIAPKGIDSDALSTSVFLKGAPLAEKICRENPKIQILIIRRDPQERTRILIERFGDIWDRDLKMESPELPAFEE